MLRQMKRVRNRVYFEGAIVAVQAPGGQLIVRLLTSSKDVKGAAYRPMPGHSRQASESCLV